MRWVVVTGLGMADAAACGVESTWRRLITASGARRIGNLDVSTCRPRLHAKFTRARHHGHAFKSHRMERLKRSGSMISIILQWGCAVLTMTPVRSLHVSATNPNRRMIGLASAVLPALRTVLVLGKGAAARFAFLHSRAFNQLGLRLRIDRVWSEGAKPCSRDGLLDRCARDRRCCAVDRARRRGGDAGRRGRVADLADRHGRVHRLQSAFHLV